MHEEEHHRAEGQHDAREPGGVRTARIPEREPAEHEPDAERVVEIAEQQMGREAEEDADQRPAALRGGRAQQQAVHAERKEHERRYVDEVQRRDGTEEVHGERADDVSGDVRRRNPVHDHIRRRIAEPDARDQVVASEVVGGIRIGEMVREQCDRELERRGHDDQRLGPSESRSHRRETRVDHRGNVGLPTAVRNVRNRVMISV